MNSLLCRASSRSPRRPAVTTAAAALTLAGLAAIPAAPAQAALPAQCVTSGSTVTCTLSENGTAGRMDLTIPDDVSSIQVHAVGERGGSANGLGGSLVHGGRPAVIDVSVPVSPGEVLTARLLDDGGAAGASSGDIESGAGGSSVLVNRGSELLVQAAGGGGAGAGAPAVPGTIDHHGGGGDADTMGFWAADNDPSGQSAGGGLWGGDRYEPGLGGGGAWLYDCTGSLVFPNGANGSGSSGGSGGAGEYGGGGGGGGHHGGGGGGAGGTGCEGFSYGGGGGGGLSVLPWNATYAYAATESYLVRITFTPDAQPATATHTPSAMTFGQVALGSTSVAQTVTVTNTGSTPLSLGEGALGGLNPTSFLKESDTCSNTTVGPGSTCQIALQFKPLASGSLGATFTIADNSSSSPRVVTLSGTGVRPIAVSSVSTLAFGAQEISRPGSAKTVTLTNTGAGSLLVSSTRFSGPNASDFSVVSDNCVGVAIPPNSSCSVSLRMTASAAGYRSGTFTFVHNAAQPSSDVSLTGIGTPPADLLIRGIGSVYTGRDHWVTRTVAGPDHLMTYPLAIYNEDTVARSYKIALSRTGAASTAEVWTTGFGAKSLPQHNPGVFTTALIQPKKAVTFNLRVTPTAAGQGTSFVAVALLSDHGGLIEGVGTATNTAAPLDGTSAFELFSKQGSQLFVGGPVNGQTSTGPALNVGESAPFTLRLKNNGTSSQRIGLRLTDVDGCAGSFAVTVTAAGQSVTGSAFNGTYLTPLLAPNGYQDVFVSLKRIAARCPSKTIRAQSLNNGVAVRTSYLLGNAAYNAATD